jgi:hypothetical protein
MTAFTAAFSDSRTTAATASAPFTWIRAQRPPTGSSLFLGSWYSRIQLTPATCAAGWAWGGTQDDKNYQSEQILSTTLFRIYRSTGGDSSYLDKRQLASRYLLMVMTHAMAALPIASTTLTTAPSYAAALMSADAGTPTFQGIPGGAIGKVVRWAFEKQGLYQPAGAPTPVTTPGGRLHQ